LTSFSDEACARGAQLLDSERARSPSDRPERHLRFLRPVGCSRPVLLLRNDRHGVV